MVQSFIAWLKTYGDQVQGLEALIALLVIAFFPIRWFLKRRKQSAPATVADLAQLLTAQAVPKGIHMDAETYTEIQRKDLERALAIQAQTHGEERKRLQEKIDTLNARLANPDEALAQQQAIITNLEDQLTRRGNQLGGDATLAAKTALEAGDFTKARALFESLAAETAPDVQTHAEAAFALGQIAEAEVRWHDAAGHYARAAQLDPNFETLRKASLLARHSGDYLTALRQSSILLVLARNQANFVRLSYALNEMASTFQALGQFGQAELLFTEALDIGREIFGDAHPEYANKLNNLGLVVQAQGRYAEAEGLYKQALDIGRNTIGELHHNFATRLNNLGLVVAAQGRYAEAEGLYKQALEIDSTTIGEMHPDFAKHLNNLACAVEAQSRFTEAEVLYRRALGIDSKTIGEAHPDFAIDLNNLAGVVEAQGRYIEAEQLYQQALKIDRKTIGEMHPEFATRLNNLASVLRAQGRYAKAEALFKQALQIDRDILTDAHPNTQDIAQNLIHLLQTHNPSSPDLPALLAAFPNP